MSISARLKPHLARLRHEATSLRTAIVLTVLAGVVVPSMLVSYQDRQLLKEQFAEQLNRDLVVSTELLAKNVQEPLWNFAKEDTLVLVNAAMTDERIVSVEIMKDVDQVLVPFLSQHRTGEMPRSIKMHSAQIKRNGNAIGSVVVTMDAESYRRKLDAALKRDIFRVVQTLIGSLTLILLLLHFRLVKPLRRLVDASVTLEQGNFGIPIATGYFDELGQLARSMEATRQALIVSFEELEDRVDERTLALAESLQVAELARREAMNTLKELRETQTQLIQSEKMAAMGQLITNVAHELNTPIGAVKSSGQSISESLNDVLVGMPSLFAQLDPFSRDLFTQLLLYSGGTSKVLLAPREERIARRKASLELQAAGIDEPDSKARILVQLGVHQIIAVYLPLLSHPECDAILGTAQSACAIINSAININMAVERVSRIVFALKSFTPPNTNASLHEVDLRASLDDVLTLYQSQISQSITLIRQYEEIPPLRSQIDQLNQVWSHLIHNALQSMLHQGTLAIGIRCVEDMAIVTITDTGCGIPESIREKIFDAFFTTRLSGEGGGLGLYTAKKIVETHHGRIEVRSEEGVGSIFTVYLPYDAK